MIASMRDIKMRIITSFIYTLLMYDARYLEDVTVHPTYLMSAKFEPNRQASEYATTS